MNLRRLVAPAIGLLMVMGAVPANADPASSDRVPTVARQPIHSTQTGVRPFAGGGYAVTTIGSNFAFDYGSDPVLDVPNWDLNDRARVQMWGYRGSGNVSNQRWDIVNIGNNTYEIKNRNSGKCLDKSQDNGNVDGAAVYQLTCNGQDNQRWWVDSSGGGQRLHNEADDNRCLDIAAFGGWGTLMQVWSCSWGWNQVWWFTVE